MTLTLTDALADAGYTHRPSGRGYRYSVIGQSGEVVFTGSANDVWCWLHELADIARDPDRVVQTLDGLEVNHG